MRDKIIYLAGLFDGEGCVTYKQRREHRKGKPRSYLYWQIRIEINMIDKDTIDFVAETLGITLAYLKKNMSLEELYGWNAYFKLKGEREEKAYQDAQKKAQYRKVR